MPFMQEPGPLQAGDQNGSASCPFQELVRELSDVLGPSSGLDSEEIDPEVIQDLMRSYPSCESEWGQYALGDSSRHYTRNLVDEGNGKSNLVRPFAVWQEVLLTRAAHSCVEPR